eukprot:UN08029
MRLAITFQYSMIAPTREEQTHSEEICAEFVQQKLSPKFASEIID